MNSLNKRYCVSSFFVLLLMSFVMGFSFAKFRNANSCVTENSALFKNDICVVRMTKKSKVQKTVQTHVNVQKPEPQKVEKIPETELPENPVLESTATDENLDNSENIQGSSETQEKNESVDSGKISESIKSYKAYVLNRIASKKTYPLSARKKGYEGKVKIHLVIDKDGKILALEVCEPCEFEMLNNAALKSVEKAAPFKKMPDVMTSLDFIFVLDFKLSASVS